MSKTPPQGLASLDIRCFNVCLLLQKYAGKAFNVCFYLSDQFIALECCYDYLTDNEPLSPTQW